MTATTAPTVRVRRVNPLRVFWRHQIVRRFLSNKLAVIGLIGLSILVVVAIFAPALAPYDPGRQDLSATFADPFSPGHVLGTDNLGRDVLSRLIDATRVALGASALALVTALVIGVLPGIAAGYFGGWVETVVMRITDALQCLPPLILAIAVIGAVGPGLRNAMLILGVIYAPNFVRVIRAAILEVKEETFVEASRSIGSSTSRILMTRVIPNAIPPVLVQIYLVFGFALIAEASLSLLGLGAQSPTASWGSMLSQGYTYLNQSPWLVVPPGLAITLTVLFCNLVGDGVRDSIGRQSIAGRSN
jgi:peptide/nickel transport system permease protein